MTAVEPRTTSTGSSGRPLRRKEDPRLISGRGTYVDDIVLPGMLYAAVVRSTEAHAKIVSIDAESALERDSVRAVLGGDDLDLKRPLPMIWHPPDVEIREPEHWPLARGEVNH